MSKTETSSKLTLPEEEYMEEAAPPVEEPSPSEEKEETSSKTFWISFLGFLRKNEFPLLIFVSIGLAKAYPPLGNEYLAPEITATWIAVALIFFLGGVGLKTEEFSKAFERIYFNGFLQIFNFGFVSAVVYAVSRLLVATKILDQALADGMVICSSLPMAINVAIVLTAAAGGDEAAAIFNSTFGNIVGIFLSPLLILMYLGKSGDVSLGEVFYKLTLRVVVPLIIGQLVQKYVTGFREFYLKHKRRFKKLQEYCLVFIVYTVFCRTFEADAGAGLGDTFLMIAFQVILMAAFMGIAWYALRFLFRDEPELRVMGLFGCIQKTVSLGVPLIGSIYEGNPNVGLYTLPLLVWHPMQLVVGSMLVPRLAQFIIDERERLSAEECVCNEASDGTDIEAQDGVSSPSSEETEDDAEQPTELDDTA